MIAALLTRLAHVAAQHRVVVLVAAACVVLSVGVVAWAGTGFDYDPIALGERPSAGGRVTTEVAKDLHRLVSRQAQLENRLRRMGPPGRYIVIDQTQNRLYLKNKTETLLEAVCSAGSGMILSEGSGGRTWMFDTPRGNFRVISKISNPIWRKPDWAFVEEGKPIPRNMADRLEYGTLGEYALYFGNGFMIHGTLYERLLGRSVSHGCIRLGRDDLRKLYAAAPVGTPIFIY